MGFFNFNWLFADFMLSVLYCSEIVTLFLETVIEESLFQTRFGSQAAARGEL